MFHNTVRGLDQVIDVHYYLPGFPPTPKIVKDAVTAILSCKLPPKGAVLAPNTALCEECPRKKTKPEKLLIGKFYRPYEVILDPEKCFLAQGVLCMGVGTRGGCEALCINGNMPCTGCFGPTSRVQDQGAKLLSGIASIVDATEENKIDDILGGIPDPTGTFYRYSLPSSTLRRKIMKKRGDRK